jgi:alpha-L-rhamnosidase
MLNICKIRCEYQKNPVGIDAARPRLSWQLASDGQNVVQTACRIQVSCDDPGFKSILWDSGIVQTGQSIHFEYSGPPLLSRTRYDYRIRIWDNKGFDSGWSETAFWEMGLLDPDDWSAQWITPYQEASAPDDLTGRMLRKAFTLKKKVRKARLYATSLGLYEMFLNGRRVGDRLFTPGWTSYNKRLQVQTYDVTDYLQPGENAAGIVLNGGWYTLVYPWAKDYQIFYGDRPAALAQLMVEYEDGTEDAVTTDASWKTTSGPILMSHIFYGETYDARREKPGWSEEHFDDTGWEDAALHDYRGGALVAQVSEPVRVIQELKPVSIFTTPAGETVIDFGQNMTGWVRFEVEGEKGAEVRLQHAELLDRCGNFYTENLRAAVQIVRYTLKGKGLEVFEPHFTYHGFRYVKVESYPGPVDPARFTGRVICTDMEPIGHFSCSNDEVNRLQENIQWSQKGNALDLPTDCPQRNERQGWTGDAEFFSKTACFNMNTALFFTKWLKDLYADQTGDKGTPNVVPAVLDSYAAAGWGDAATICPWTVYQCFGDTRILEEQYDSMKMWVEYIRRQGDNEYLWNTGSHYGDWLAMDAPAGSLPGATPRDFIATAYYAYSTDLLAKAAEILGKADDAVQYETLHDNILAAFRKEFVTPGGRLAAHTQTGYVLALMFGLVEEKDRKRTADSLARAITDNGNRLSTGTVGTQFICNVLSENGYNDLAYKLLLQTECPSWLYEVRKGATTIWERWDGIKEDGSFFTKYWDIPSFNHDALGAVGDWLYSVVGGIGIGLPGYKHILIAPKPDPGLSFAKASLESMYGRIDSSWSRQDGRMIIETTLPPNTTATVTLPFASLNDANLARLPEMAGARQTAEGVRVEIGSGHYQFTYQVNES